MQRRQKDQPTSPTKINEGIMAKLELDQGL
jgi:hypothetical protein